MIDFTLSKLNLLIFVLAVAAIVIFFMNTVNSNLRTRQSFELVYKVGQEIKVGIDNPSYCSVKYVEIPRRIKINYGFASSHNINYILRMSAHDIPNSGGKIKLVLAILDYKGENVLSAYDIDFNGSVHFYEWTFSGGKYSFAKVNNNGQNILELRPDDVDSIDQTLVVSKKIKGGKTEIHIFSCGLKNNIPGCNDFSTISQPDQHGFITQLIKEEKIDCLCMSDTLSMVYGTQQVGNKIAACQ